MPESSQNHYACPDCGAEVRVGSPGCRHCTPRHPTDAAEAPDWIEEPFDYEAFVREEFGPSWKPNRLAWGWWITGIVLLAALLAQLL